MRVLSSCVIFISLGFFLLGFFNSTLLTEQNHAYCFSNSQSILETQMKVTSVKQTARAEVSDEILLQIQRN